MTRRELTKACDELAELTKNRKHLLKARTKLTNQMKAIARGMLVESGKLDPTKKQEVSNPVLARIIKCSPVDGEFGMKHITLNVLDESRRTLTAQINTLEKDIERIVQTLPVWNLWAANIRGVGKITLGTIIGGSVGAGGKDPFGKKLKKFTTIGDYSNPSKLYKRWGVGMVDGERQRRIKSTDEERKHFEKTGEATGGLLKALKHGYCPTRRADLYMLGANGFLKQGEYYKRRYDQEKERQKNLHPKPVKEGNKTSYTKGHLHSMAMRHTTKLFLRDLWNKWREIHGGGEYHQIGARFR